MPESISPSADTSSAMLICLRRIIEALLRLAATEQIDEARKKLTDLQRAILDACSSPATGTEIAKAIDKKQGDIIKTVYGLAERGLLLEIADDGQKRYLRAF